ncbi:unnamed protein product, partial [Choristocarpus tenellus]
SQVLHAPEYSKRSRAAVLSIDADQIPEGVSPLIVFVNGRSGGKQGASLLSHFRHLLNPLQVVDLGEEGPVDALGRFRNIPNLRLLCCGGDGTVAWLLEAVEQVEWRTKRPPLAVLPLGTGNDLARVLGWGGGYEGESLESLLDTIDSAQVTLMDRWSVSVNATGKGMKGMGKGSSGGGGGGGRKDRQLIMNNYLGIGVDGQVALDFHQMREARPLLFFNRAINKVLVHSV